MKKKVLVVSLMLGILLGIYFLYDTFAIEVSKNSNAYNINLTDNNETVTVEAGSYKTIIYKIFNSNNGKLKYGVGYTNSDNILVLLYEDSESPASGFIDKNGYKYIKLRIINKSSSAQSTTLSAILGYENGGELIVPSGTTLVTEVYGDNLVKNGSLVYRDNTNFSKFTYGEDEEGKYLSYSGDSNVTLTSNEYIEIDPNKKYYISAEVKSSNPNAKYYIGFEEYDIDKKFIYSYYYMYVSNSLAYLTKDLNNGDTIVYLNDVSGFGPSHMSGGEWEANERGFIFWNYKDSTGYTYSPLTYSRNAYLGLFAYDNINYENNTITLTSPWNNGTFKAGTKLSQSFAGSVFNYVLLSYKSLADTYTTYKGEVTGTINDGKMIYTKFRPGTKYIKPLILFNYNNTPNATFYMRNFTIKEIK